MARAKQKSDAEKIFDIKLADLLSTTITKLHPDSGNTPLEVLTIPSTPLDKASIEKTFFQYGTYLEFVGGDTTVEQTQVFQFPRQKEPTDV